jgi:hypothetical protein
MYQLRRSARIGCEDLMRELEVIEQKLLKEDSALAMELMVLEAKLRERFQHLERMGAYDGLKNEGPGMPLDALQALIPQDLPNFPTVQELNAVKSRNRMWETVGTAALLAVFTALGVFGLASVLQIGLSWLA